MVSPFSDSQASSVIQNIEKKLRSMKGDIEALKRENDEEEKQLQNVIDDLREEKAKLEQIKMVKTDQLNAVKLDINKIKNDINEVLH